jgi:DnaJ-class molecular chaperone
MQANMEQTMEKLKTMMGDKMQHLNANMNPEEMQKKFKEFMEKYQEMSDEEKDKLKEDLMKRTMNMNNNNMMGDKGLHQPNYFAFVGMVLLLFVVFGKRGRAAIKNSFSLQINANAHINICSAKNVLIA